MGKFNPANYETVEERLRRFKKDWPDSRIETELVDVVGNIGRSRWTVKASVWKDRTSATGEYDRPDSTGYAMEIDGSGRANDTSALENCETSAIGRALANLNYQGNRRATREEMEKVQREEERQAQEQQMRKQWLSEQANKLLQAEKAGQYDSVRRVHAWAQAHSDAELTRMAASTLERMDKAIAEGRLTVNNDQPDQGNQPNQPEQGTNTNTETGAQPSAQEATEAVQQELGGEVIEGEIVND